MISEYQKQIILDNPKMTVPQLSKMAGCSEKTVKNYRRSIREGKFGPTRQEGGQESATVPACAIKEDGGKLPDGVYSPKELANDLSELCRSELAMYKMSESKIQKDGPDNKTVWESTQHFKNYVSGATSLAKWFGMEKLTLITEQPQEITKERFDKMSADDIEKLMKQCLE